MKKNIIYIGIFSLLFLGSCKKYEDEGFLNGPTVEDLLANPSLDDLVLLTKGVEAQAKVDINMYVDIVGAIGREAFDLNGVDPRYTGELLGIEGGPLDPGGFLTNRSYAARYRTIRQANNLLEGLENTTATLTAEQVNGFKGFANTMIANALQLNLNMQYDNGLRVDVADADNLGERLSRSQTQIKIYELLDLAYSQLTSAGDEFSFTLGTGFADFGTPAGFAMFNRALAARSALNANNNSLVLSYLNDSFMDMAGSMNMGGYLSYLASDGVNNPLNHTDKYMAHMSFINDATAGDSRLSKVQAQDELTFDGLTSSYRASIYSDNSDNLSIIRNEELILIYAEANIGSNITNVITAINTVRNAAGIGDYTGGGSEAELMDEIVRQRRYSLFGEGHRWVDMRRWNRLDELPSDRSGDVVHFQFPVPFGE